MYKTDNIVWSRSLSGTSRSSQNHPGQRMKVPRPSKSLRRQSFDETMIWAKTPPSPEVTPTEIHLRLLESVSVPKSSRSGRLRPEHGSVLSYSVQVLISSINLQDSSDWPVSTQDRYHPTHRRQNVPESSTPLGLGNSRS
jgi:hypothetical protein